jgi:hypothetical protein
MELLLMSIRHFFFLLLVGCEEVQKTTLDDIEVETVEQDEDGDGYNSDEDCDDSNPLVNNGADEVCDGIDNNCDGETDENVSATYYQDDDGDGFGASDLVVEACEVLEGFVPNGNDCDDQNETVSLEVQSSVTT